MHKRQLVLEDGTVFEGEGFGSDIEQSGEVIFHTGMTGYQEVLSNPSCCGQFVVMTYPLIGNGGINRDDFESVAPSINGLIVKEYMVSPTNDEEGIDSFLNAYDIPGLAGIDTRKLTRLLREKGSMKGYLTDGSKTAEAVVDQLKKEKLAKGLVASVSTPTPYVVPGRGDRVVLVDYGMKQGVLRELVKRNCHVTVVPYNYISDNIIRLKPDAIVLSNGPGNPKDIPEAIQMIHDILGTIPVFGIGLGQQILALACGADTEKMLPGHHGTNYPVKDFATGKTYLTSQHHNHTVTHESLGLGNLEATHINLNDKSVEGIKHKKYPAFAVQFQPESAPGPEDTYHIFDDLLKMIAKTKAEKGVNFNA